MYTYIFKSLSNELITETYDSIEELVLKMKADVIAGTGQPVQIMNDGVLVTDDPYRISKETILRRTHNR